MCVHWTQYSYSSGLLGLNTTYRLCFHAGVNILLMWCSFAINLLVVTLHISQPAVKYRYRIGIPLKENHSIDGLAAQIGLLTSDSRDDFRGVRVGHISLLLPPGVENPNNATGSQLRYRVLQQQITSPINSRNSHLHRTRTKLPSIEVGTTPLAWLMTLNVTYDLDLQIPASYDYDLLACKRSRSTVSRFRRQSGNKRTDRRTYGRKRLHYLPR